MKRQKYQTIDKPWTLLYMKIRKLLLCKTESQIWECMCWQKNQPDSYKNLYNNNYIFCIRCTYKNGITNEPELQYLESTRKCGDYSYNERKVEKYLLQNLRSTFHIKYHKLKINHLILKNSRLYHLLNTLFSLSY